MKTKLSDLTEHLFNEVERLLDDECVCTDEEKTKTEIEKAKAISGLSEQIINVKEVQRKEIETNVSAMKTLQSMGYKFIPEGMNVKPLPLEETLKGTTPEGLEYEL